MTQQAAIALGQSLRVLATAPGDPAALVCPDVRIGTPDDDRRPCARSPSGASAVTLDHEQVPGAAARARRRRGRRAPRPDALLHAQDKLVMRERLPRSGSRCRSSPRCASPADVERFAAEHGPRVVLKAVRGGYDGRGVWLLPPGRRPGPRAARRGHAR
jgi:5-(carboxyamino)imidazole ribonucleotide synthase